VLVINLQQNCHVQITHCRMARSGLRWSLNDLARHSGVSRRTIARFELGGRVNPETVLSLRRALEAAGAKFIESDEAVGVVLKDRES
jgi:transcriptional regulator with XRE-family HTH domain